MNIVNKVTDTLSESLDYFDNSVKAVSSNKYVHTYVAPVVALLLVLWVVMAAPKLPKSVVQFFDYPVVKIIYMFLIVFIATHNPSVAIIATVALLVMLQTLASYETAEKLIPTVSSSPTVMAQLSQTITDNKDAAVEAVNKGKMELAQTLATQAAKIEATMEALLKADAHKEAATIALKSGDKEVAQAHAIEANKYNNTAKALKGTPVLVQQVQQVVPQTGCGSMACSNQEQQHGMNNMMMRYANENQDNDIHSADNVIGYNEMRGNEDYGRANTCSDINLSYNGPVRGARENFNQVEGHVEEQELFADEEHAYEEQEFFADEEPIYKEQENFTDEEPAYEEPKLEEKFMNLDNLMSVNNEFNDPKLDLGCSVGGIRKDRDNDLDNYAPFKLYGSFDKGKRGVKNTREQKVETFWNENPASVATEFEVAVGIPSNINKDRLEDHTVFPSNDNPDYASFQEQVQQKPLKNKK